MFTKLPIISVAFIATELIILGFMRNSGKVLN